MSGKQNIYAPADGGAWQPGSRQTTGAFPAVPSDALTNNVFRITAEPPPRQETAREEEEGGGGDKD